MVSRTGVNAAYLATHPDLKVHAHAPPCRCKQQRPWEPRVRLIHIPGARGQPLGYRLTSTVSTPDFMKL